MSSVVTTMASEDLSYIVQTRSASPELDAATPVVQKAALHTPTDSLVSISLTESDLKSDRKSEESTYSVETTPKDVVEEVIRRAASAHISPIDSIIEDRLLESPGAGIRLVHELAMEKEFARSRSNSMVVSGEMASRGRSDSGGSEISLRVDWETLDRTEQDQEGDNADDEVSHYGTLRLDRKF